MPRRLLDKETVRAMRVAFYDDGEMLKDIAKRFGTSKPNAGSIITFRTWAYVLHHGRRYSHDACPVRQKKPKLGTPRSRCACGVFIPTGSTVCERCLDDDGAPVVLAPSQYIEIPACLRRGAD